jgi:hypothetical protein
MMASWPGRNTESGFTICPAMDWPIARAREMSEYWNVKSEDVVAAERSVRAVSMALVRGGGILRILSGVSGESEREDFGVGIVRE